MDPSLPELLILLLLKTRLSPFAGKDFKKNSIFLLWCIFFFVEYATSSGSGSTFCFAFCWKAFCNVYCGGRFVWLQPAKSAEREKTIGWIACALFSEPVFLNVYGAPESISRMSSASLRSLAGRYDNPLPPRFLAPIDSLKIPVLSRYFQTFMEPRNQFQGMNSASLWSLAGLT